MWRLAGASVFFDVDAVFGVTVVSGYNFWDAYGGSSFLCNGGTYLPNYTASHARRL